MKPFHLEARVVDFETLAGGARQAGDFPLHAAAATDAQARPEYLLVVLPP